jgi:hypothetical protein
MKARSDECLNPIAYRTPVARSGVGTEDPSSRRRLLKVGREPIDGRPEQPKTIPSRRRLYSYRGQLMATRRETDVLTHSSLVIVSSFDL